MKNGTFTFGTTPEDVIKSAWNTASLNHDVYDMGLVGEDAQIMVAIVNQGIDSHLTAITNSKFNWKGHRLVCVIGDSNDLCVILRRLYYIGSEAWSLRSSILETLDIEEI